MTKQFAVGMWVLGALIDLLSWSSIGSSERSFHMALILMFGAVVVGLIGQSSKPRSANSDTIRPPDERSDRR